jgi:hypothetical protein
LNFKTTICETGTFTLIKESEIIEGEIYADTKIDNANNIIITDKSKVGK